MLSHNLETKQRTIPSITDIPGVVAMESSSISCTRGGCSLEPDYSLGFAPIDLISIIVVISVAYTHAKAARAQPNLLSLAIPHTTIHIVGQ